MKLSQRRCAFVALGLLLASCASAPPQELIIRAGRLFDGHSKTIREHVRVIVRAGVVVAIEPDTGPLPKAHTDRAIIDGRQLTIMPGIIDSHMHLLTSGACTPGLDAGLSQANRNLRALLRAGVTTVADLAAPLPVALGLRRYVGTARGRGPRVLVAGPMLTAEHGYLTHFQEGELVDLGMLRPLSHAEEARTSVRELAARGVDFIKVALQEVHFDGSPLAMLESETFCAIVQEAHQQHLRVLAHALTRAAYDLAVACNADAIVHGAIETIEAPTLRTLAARKTPVAPTLMVLHAPLWGLDNADYLDRPFVARVLGKKSRQDLLRYIAANDPQSPTLPDFFMPGLRRAAIAQAVAHNVQNTQRFYEAGVPLAMGTDAGNCFSPVGSVVEELKRLHQAGVPKHAVLAAATSGSARLLNMHDALGRIAVGYRADIIAIDGRPDEDLAAMDRVVWTMIDGVLQQFSEASFWHTLSLASRISWAAISE